MPVDIYGKICYNFMAKAYIIKTLNSQSNTFYVSQRAAGAVIAVFGACEGAAVSRREESRSLFTQIKYVDFCA